MTTVLESLGDKLDPRHTALLVVDMQNDFCASEGYVAKVGRDVSRCQAAVKPISQLVDAARASGVRVAWVQAQYDPDKIPEPMRVRLNKMGNGVFACLGGSWGAEPYGVTPAKGETVVVKHCFSGFSGTDLDRLLREGGIRSLVIVGVQTNVCVDSTLRDAHSRGYYIVVPRDGVASHMKEAHEATLINVAFCYGDVVDSADVLKHWMGPA